MCLDVIVTATSKNTTKSASATVNVVVPGLVTATANVQVAQYIVAPAAGNVFVQFGQDTNYALTTWTQPVPSGRPSKLVRRRNEGEHHVSHERSGAVRRRVTIHGCGPDVHDAGFGTAQLPTITATGTPGMTLQNGVEMLNLVTLTTSALLTALVTDLSGDVLWAYDPGTSVPAGSLVEPIKLLPNGHFLITFTVSTAGLASSSVRAVDLAGTGSGFGGNSYWANDVDGSEQQLFIS